MSKIYSEKTLMSWNKKELVRYIRCLEHNVGVLEEGVSNKEEQLNKIVNEFSESLFDAQIVQKLPSLYPLQEFEEKAIIELYSWMELLIKQLNKILEVKSE